MRPNNGRFEGRNQSWPVVIVRRFCKFILKHGTATGLRLAKDSVREEGGDMLSWLGGCCPEVFKSYLIYI